MITESWLSDGAVLDKDVVDLEYGTNLKIIYRNRPRRPTGARRVGGGVSIVFNKSTCNFRERKISGNKFEIVAATGRIGKLARTVALFCVYIQPKILVDELVTLNDLINNEILLLKSKGDPIVIVGGDLNRRSLADAVDDFPDMTQANFEPTRGPACLDIAFTNFTEVTSEVWPPLATPDGTLSDHQCVIYNAREQHTRKYTWMKKTTRKHTEKAVADFGRELDNASWDAILGTDLDDPDVMIDRYNRYIAQLTDKHFPLKTVRHRSDEDPWITEGIRKLSRLKARIFKRDGKSNFWLRLRDEQFARVQASKLNFIDTMEGKSTRSFFSAVKSLSCKAKPQQWTVTDLFPDDSQGEAAEKTASYFTRITDTFDPLPPSRGTHTMRRPVTEEEVLKVLKNANKPSSLVEGDMLPRLMKAHFDKVKKPVCAIFNAVFRSGSWPTSWKEETTVVIPKVNNPESLSECRNISCTPFLSKVLESVLLQDLRDEIPLDQCQYGGIKNCSVDHLLVDLLEGIMNPLDRGNASVLLALDFEKAFNRLNHKECLAQLRKLGASPQTVDLIRSFLTNRHMRVRVGTILSSPRLLKGGSPQGSILGCLLYCLATQQLGGDLLQRGHPWQASPTTHSTPPTTTGPSPPVAASPTGGFEVPSWAISDPNILAASPSTDDSFTTARQSPSTLTPSSGLEESIEQFAIEFFKYIDDTSLLQTIDIARAVRHISSAAPTESLPSEDLDWVMQRLTSRAEEIGMKINGKKTQVLVVAPANGYLTTTSVRVEGTVVTPVDALKLLGFHINSSCSMTEQVKALVGKFRKRFWSLIHLRGAGISGDRLFRLYICLVRPVLEVNSVIFHSMLSKQQSNEIEKLQKKVIRLCYGQFYCYETIRNTLSIESLVDRRVKAVKRFVSKALKNDRFSDKWFVRRPEVDTELRRRDPFIVRRARTEKYRNSPLLSMQRVANDLVSVA